MASYPGGIKAFTPRVDGAGAIIFASHVNDLQDEVNAVETGLLSGFAHVLRPDSTANNRDIGLTTARWRDLLLGRTIDIAQGTITTDLKALDLTATWNAGAVVFTVLKANVTDTASASLSRFLDLQLGGVSRFFIYKDGSINSLAFAGIGAGADGAVARLLLDNGTITSNIKVLDAKTTWNAGGVTFTGILLNVTDTASAAASLLADLQVGGVSKFKVDKTGQVTPAGAVVLPADPTTALQAATKQYVDARFEGQAQNAASATLSATGITVVTLDLGTVVTNDLIYVSGQMDVTKGATTGRTRLQVQPDSGTAVIKGASDIVAFISDEPNHPASKMLLYHASGIFKVITGGTLILKVFGLSEGSDGTVAIGTCGLRAVVQRN